MDLGGWRREEAGECQEKLGSARGLSCISLQRHLADSLTIRGPSLQYEPEIDSDSDSDGSQSDTDIDGTDEEEEGEEEEDADEDEQDEEESGGSNGKRRRQGGDEAGDDRGRRKKKRKEDKDPDLVSVFASTKSSRTLIERSEIPLSRSVFHERLEMHMQTGYNGTIRLERLTE